MCCLDAHIPVLQHTTPTRPVRHSITVADINKVHCAVEHALLLRCTLDETARSLEAAGVAPAIFTRLVWKQLEEQNPSFFQEYYRALAAQKQPQLFTADAAQAA
jgi:uncharacterized protein (TIGR01589 family)